MVRYFCGSAYLFFNNLHKNQTKARTRSLAFYFTFDSGKLPGKLASVCCDRRPLSIISNKNISKV